MNENLSEIGKIADTLDNLTALMSKDIPAKMHLEGMKEAIPIVSARLKKAVIAETGEDPWGIEDNPPTEEPATIFNHSIYRADPMPTPPTGEPPHGN